MTKIICISGLTGWQDHIQNVYDNFEEFEGYCKIYNIHERLGYDGIKECWNDNPIAEGSVNPSDYRKINT
jgi:hypothetical protein